MPGVLCAQWEIPKFVAYEGPPARAPDYRNLFENSIDPSVEVSLLDEVAAQVSPGWRLLEIGQETGSPLSATQLRLLELFLEQAALEMSNMGFADPTASGWLDSVVLDENGDKAIRFYVYDHPYGNKAPWAFYDSGEECNDGRLRKVVNINTASFAPPDKAGNRVIRGRDWATLAHELFHAVIHASEFMRDRCKVGWWISEAVPDAISYDLTRQLRGETFETELQPREADMLKVYGARDFTHPLEDHVRREGAGEKPRKQLAYRTSSFWRYLAEAKYVKARNPNSQWPGSLPGDGVDSSAVDYSYIADLFATRNPYARADRQDPRAEIRWVNNFLKSEPHIKSTLARVYIRFISALANFHEDRVGPAKDQHMQGWPAPTMAQWMGFIFGAACEQARGQLDGNDGAWFDLRLNPNAAGCVQVNPSGPMPMDTAVVIMIIDNDENALKQLRIGLPDGTVVSAPEIHSFMGDQPPFIARWTLPLFAVRESTYIFSNMASQPHLTKPFSGEAYFNLGTWESDMTTVPLPAPAPPVKKRGPRPTKREQIKNNAEEAVKEPMKRLIPTQKVDRKGYDKPGNCDPMRQRLNKCGPQLVISLGLSPFGPPQALRGTGDVVSIFSEVAAFNPENALSTMTEYASVYAEVDLKLQAMDGTKISIAIPRIDYGFTGSFNNADIKVRKGNSPDRGYRSYGPVIEAGGRKYWQPPNGKVTIEEYSHRVIRGSFSADLIDESKRDSNEFPVIAKTISGRFAVMAPFETDEDFAYLEEHFEEEMIQNMLDILPSGFAPVQDIMQNSGPPSAEFCQKLDAFQLRALGLEEACLGAAGGELQQCSCECDARPVEKPQPACQSQCRNDWKKCPIPDDQLGEGLAAEVAHYRSLLKAGGMPPEVQEGLVEAFKKMPKWQRDLTIQGFK